MSTREQRASGSEAEEPKEDNACLFKQSKLARVLKGELNYECGLGKREFCRIPKPTNETSNVLQCVCKTG